MTILFILAVWIGLSTLVCLELVGVAARPMPHVTDHGDSSQQVEADGNASEPKNGNATRGGVTTYPSAYSVG